MRVLFNIITARYYIIVLISIFSPIKIEAEITQKAEQLPLLFGIKAADTHVSHKEVDSNTTRTRATSLNYELLRKDWQGEGSKIRLNFFPDIELDATIEEIEISGDSRTMWKLHIIDKRNFTRMMIIDINGHITGNLHSSHGVISFTKQAADAHVVISQYGASRQSNAKTQKSSRQSNAKTQKSSCETVYKQNQKKLEHLPLEIQQINKKLDSLRKKYYKRGDWLSNTRKNPQVLKDNRVRHKAAKRAKYFVPYFQKERADSLKPVHIKDLSVNEQNTYKKLEFEKRQINNQLRELSMPRVGQDGKITFVRGNYSALESRLTAINQDIQPIQERVELAQSLDRAKELKKHKMVEILNHSYERAIGHAADKLNHHKKPHYKEVNLSIKILNKKIAATQTELSELLKMLKISATVYCSCY